MDLHQAACATNLVLDGILFREACRAGVEKVVYASSGCVYPNYPQTDPNKVLYLAEDMVGPPCDADNMYGWAKLMGNDAQGLLLGLRNEVSFLSLLHGLRRARAREPRSNCDDCPGAR